MVVVPFERLNKNDSLLLILDLQTGLYGLARDFDPTLYYNNMIAHAAIGQIFDIPVILSTSAQNGPNGNLPKEILGRWPFFGWRFKHEATEAQEIVPWKKCADQRCQTCTPMLH